MDGCASSEDHGYSFFTGLALSFLIIGLAVRLALAPLLTYPFDIEHWAVILQNTESGNGLFNLTGYFYTPVWGYILGFEDLLVNVVGGAVYGDRFTDLLGIEAMAFPYYTATTTTPAFNVMMKLPLIAVDVLVGYIVYRLVLSEGGDVRRASVAFGLWFLCPIVIYMSSVQAQFDCISALFALLCVLLMRRGFFFLAGAMFTLASLIKFFPAFCILILCVYVYRTASDRADSLRNLFLAVAGALIVATVVFLPQILDGTFMDAFSFVFGRTSEYDVLQAIRTYPFLIITVIAMVVLMVLALRMDREVLEDNLLLLVLSMLSVCTIFSSGPQYWIVYLPLMTYYIVCRDRNRALLGCTVAMGICTVLTAFINNNLSILTSAAEYLGLCDPASVLAWMGVLDAPAAFGLTVAALITTVTETIQLIIMCIMAIFLLSDLGIFDRYKFWSDFILHLRTALGGEIDGQA